MKIIIILLILNAIAHIFSFRKLKAENSSNANGVAGFIFINAVLALILGLGFSWAKFPVLIFPAIGALGLLFTTIFKGEGTLIDFTILILDILIIGLTLKFYFL